MVHSKELEQNKYFVYVFKLVYKIWQPFTDYTVLFTGCSLYRGVYYETMRFVVHNIYFVKDYESRPRNIHCLNFLFSVCFSSFFPLFLFTQFT